MYEIASVVWVKLVDFIECQFDIDIGFLDLKPYQSQNRVCNIGLVPQKLIIA